MFTQTDQRIQPTGTASNKQELAVKCAENFQPAWVHASMQSTVVLIGIMPLGCTPADK